MREDKSYDSPHQYQKNVTFYRQVMFRENVRINDNFPNEKHSIHAKHSETTLLIARHVQTHHPLQQVHNNP